MKGSRSTRGAFLTSLMSLVLCFAMLLGTTFAWFTDNASTAVNMIQAGTLDIQLLDESGGSLEGRSLEWTKAEGTEEVLWEPGCTYFTQGFQILNQGTLDLKFKIFVNGITGGNAHLLQAIDFYLTTTKDSNLTGAIPLSDFTSQEFKLASGMYWQGTIDIDATGGENAQTVYLVGHMKESAGNEFQGEYIDGVGITLYATQLSSEFDSFGSDYDEAATWPIEIVQPVVNQTMTEVKDGDTVTAYTYKNSAETVKATVPAAAVAENATPAITIQPTEVPADVNTTISAAGKDAITYEINVTGLKENNNQPVTVELYVGKNLNDVKVYHNDAEMTSGASYASSTGVVTISTASFSPFTIAFDAPTLNQDAAGNFTIGSAGELMFFAKDVNEKGNNYKGKTVKLIADIDLSGKTWTPVGQTGGYSAKTYFQGTFDGNGHIIHNLTIPASTWEAGSNDGQHFATGFFGFIDASGATITNVTFENATVEGHHWVGVAAGYMSGTVSGVKVTNSTITSTYKNSEADGDKAGGVVGYLNSGSLVTGCTVTGSTITAVRDCGSVVGHSVGTVTGNTAANCTVYYSTDNADQGGGEIAGKRANGVSDNTATDVTVAKQVSVSTADELSVALNATYSADTLIKLANDITLSGEWGEHTLKGTNNNTSLTIDGNGKTIYGLTSSEYKNSNGFNSNGLVTAIQSSLSSVTFKNLTVSGANLTNNGGVTAASGVFVGDINTVKVTFDTCTVTDANVTSNAYAAGFVGYVQDVYSADPNLNCPLTLKNCTVTNSTFSGNDATGALVGLNNGSTTITRATVTGNTINGGNGYSAAALVGSSIGGTTATGVTASGNTFEITNTTGYQVHNTTYGYIYKNGQTYSVNGAELN